MNESRATTERSTDARGALRDDRLLGRRAALLALVAAALSACAAPYTLSAYQTAKLASPAYRSFVSEFHVVADAALRSTYAQLGVKPDATMPVAVLLTSGVRTGDPDRCRGFWNAHGVARTVWRSRRGILQSIRVVFCMDRLLSTGLDPRAVLRHEVVHAVAVHALGAYRASVPTWVHEALAELVSGVGHSRVQNVVARALGRVRRPPPMSALNQKGRWLYHEAYLYLRALLDRIGDGALPKLFALLRSGASIEDAASKLAGRPWSELQTEAQVAVTAKLADVSRLAGVQALWSALRAGKKDPVEGVAALRAFLQKHGDGPFGARARLLLGARLLKVGKAAEALGVIEAVIGRSLDTSASVILLHARALAANARIELARAAAEDVLRAPSTGPKLRLAAQKLLAKLPPAPPRAPTAR